MTTHKRILVVDDDPSIRRLLAYQLTKAGYQVLLSSNGLEAVDLLESDQQQPDLMLLDLMMPVFNGLEVLEKLKTSPNQVPTILMSAADLPIAHQVVVLSSPLAYVIKPFEWKDLHDKIERLLQPLPENQE